MLVTRRRILERLQIGPDVFVKVLGVKGTTVTLGIDAPPHVRISYLEKQDRKPTIDSDHQTGRVDVRP